jgi:putative peptide zinc metalloprotease protein
MSVPALQQAAEPRLPDLRQDLRIEPGAEAVDGAPTWTVIDAVQHRYIQIEDAAYHILAGWIPGKKLADVAADASRSLQQTVTVDDVAAFVRFCFENNLTVEPASGGWRNYAATINGRKHSPLMWAIHNYLFVKVPLFRPEPVLQKLLPNIEPLYTRKAALIVATLGIIGLWLVSRQWETFWTTFQHSYSWFGALSFAFALIIVKSAHELGHAFTAVRYGCRVPSMGVCLLVMFPVLYTDVSDAWRLTNRSKRLRIGAAGIAVELALACMATFAWVFLPEGTLKSIAFSIATVGWILSLAINLNPLMRFDGYYLLMDWLGVDNLQARSFAFGRWRMREQLFGLDERKPEHVSANLEKTLIIYAWLVWIYRLILFTGIALLVYHFAFKLLGIILFLVEIIYFIAKPIASELAHWWQTRRRIVSKRRGRVTMGFAALAAIACCLPISTTLRIPAVLEAEQLARIYPERAGTVTELRMIVGNKVKQGDVLAKLSAPDISHQLAVVERKLALTKMRLTRRIADGEDRAQGLILDKEFQSLRSEADGLKAQLDALTIRAPFDGTIVEGNSDIRVGQAVSRHEPFGLITGPAGALVRGYIEPSGSDRLPERATGAFLPESPFAPSIPVTLEAMAVGGAASIEIPELASVYSGSIAVRSQTSASGQPQLLPVEPQVLVTLRPQSAEALPTRSIRGVAVIEGEAQSLATAAVRRIAAVFVRESGF